MSYKKDHFRPASSALALEPRLMFDGAAAVAAVEYFDNHQDFQAEAQRQETQSVAEATPDIPAPGVPGVLLIIDARVADHQSLLAGLPANVTVRVIHGEESGIAAVSEELAKGDDFAAIHIISHGSSGSLGLGSDQISAGNLAAQGQALQAWASHLTAEADILLYGCDIAGGEAGQVFITELAHLTGADIAASTDATGAATKGGDWVLESRTGAIESSLAISQATLAAYGELLAATSITDSNAATPRATAEDSPLAITGLSVAGGASDTITLTIATTGGAAKLGTTSGLTVSGDNTAAITVTGTIANINSALAGLTYQPTVDQNSSTAGFTPSIALNVTSGGAGSLTVGNISVTAVNDAPSLATKTPLAVNEGGSASFSLQALATSANALDVDIATGQQVIGQQMVIINSLPAKGTLSYMGGAVAVGQVVPVSSLGSLRYTHNGSDLAAPDADSFNVTVSDGGGAQTPGSINITINPVNKVPTISGSPSLIEGQVKIVAPSAINLGDTADTLGNSSITISNVVTGGQGTLFLDTDNDGVVDAGEEITGTRVLTPTEAANLLTQLKFAHNGAEPNAPGAIAPTYRITVTDAGGGTGVPSAPVSTDITIDVRPNNDDPTLTNAHATSGQALAVGEGTSTTTITAAMLKIADADRDPSNPSTTTPANQLVYTIGTRPTQGEVQVNVGGGLGPEGDGWIVLGDGGRFTQAQVDAGQVRYYQTTNVAAGPNALDSFTFTVRDSAFGYDVWTDPANPTAPREGGLRDTLTGPIALQQFHFTITPLAAENSPRTTTYEGVPRPATSGFGGTDMVYKFEPGSMTNGNSGAVWNEANVGAAGGYVITDSMLKYVITRTDTKGTAGTGDDVSVTVPENETVYTLTVQPPNGVVQRNVGGTWVDIPTNGQFTQADIKAGNIRFVHDGSENHTASFGYKVSDGTPNNFGSTFALNVTPTNDRPTASGSGSAQVVEGTAASSITRLDASHLGMGDIDLSQDVAKQTGEGAQDFLWFQVTAQPVDGGSTARGTLERWNGSAWVAVTPGEWLPSTLLAATADGGTSGLRYRHDGSEPLAYTGGPKVAFSYTVRDDLTNPADPFATSIAAPADASGSAQSNVSGPATVTINITPVNDAPQVADKPGDADPAILETIAGGGATAGVNNILSGVLEGSTSTITNAYLAAVDRDNTTTQRQFRITNAPGQGTLLLNGAAIGVGSTFTQADIDAGKVAYRHNGSEINAQTTDGLGTYNDIFHFVVNDGVLEDSGAGADNNVFLITLAPTNDKPMVTGPIGPINIDSATAGNNPVSGFSVGDLDWTNPATSTDFVQVTVRLQSSGGTPITNYTTGFAGGGVQVGYGAGSGVVVTQDGNNNILQFQGTKAQVNAALAGLAVTFANDADALYKLEVIVDDRMRDGSGALVTTAADANGGELNQPATPGGTTTSVDATAYDWKTAATVPAASGNIASTTVDLRASRDNDPPVFSGPTSFTVNEDVRSRVGDGAANKFVVSDAESIAFGTPVTVTISVPSGTLHIGPTGTPGSLTPAGGLVVAIGGQGTGSITLTGRADDIQAVLNGRNFADNANDGSTGLHYTSASNVNHDQNGGDAGDVTLTLSFSEGASAIGSDVGSGSVANAVAPIATALTITAINDAPTVATGAGAIAIAGTGATAVPGFVVNDVDATDGYVLGESDGTIQATVRVLNQAGAPLLQADYVALGIALDTTASGHGATVDATLNGSTQALELRGTRDQINAYLAGLQVTFANLGSSNLDALYKVEVVADDRLRDAGTGAFIPATPVANGGATNQQAGLPAVPTTDTFDPYATTVVAYNVYNVTSNTRDLFISSINDPGKITANNVTVAEGSATLNLTGANANIVLDDSDDNGASTMEVTVTAGAGTITAVGGAGGTVTGLNTNAITISGATEAEINARLKALTVTFPDVDGPGVAASADWNGSFEVTITYNDKGNTGTRPGTLAGDTNDARAGNGDYAYADGASTHLVTTRIITVTVNGVNDAPTRTVATVTLPAGTEDTDGGAGDTVNNLFGATFSDAKDQIGGGGSTANSFSGIAITGNNAIAAQGKWQYSTNGGTTWVDLPAVSGTSAFLLDTMAKLRFDPADNFHGTPGGLVTRLVDNSSGAVTSATTADVSGANSGGTTRYSDNSNAVTLTTTVANVNDRPTATNGGVTATEDQKDASAGAGTPVSALGTDLGYSDVSDNQTAISGGGNAASAFGGIAIVGDTTSAGGSWQYSTDGTTWTDVPAGVSDTNALVLPTTASVRFNPTTADFNGTPTGGLQVRAADTVQTFASGSTLTVGATSTWSDVVTLGATVAPRNDAPGFTHAPTSPTVTENATTGSGTSINAVKLLGSGAVTDIDLGTTSALSSTVFGAGSVTVTLADGITGDVLQLDGLAAGANGIATIAGGSGSTALVVTFTNAATVAQVEAVLAAIEYTNTSDDPTNRLSGTPQTQRNYTVVLSDGNNVQSGGNAGGPAPLAATKNGTITINATNDPPLATPNTNAVTEDSGTPVTGNVKTDGTADSDPDNALVDVPVTAIVATTAGGASTPVADNAGAGTVVAGKYGTLTIHPNGSYSYALDNSNPDVNALNDTETLNEVFNYTITDPGSLSANSTLTITINGHTDGAPQIVPVDGNAGATGQATVHEKGLTSAGDTTETTTGTITVTAPDGVAKVTIGGQVFTVAQLDALSPGSPSAVIDTGEGQLRITGIGNKTGAPGAPVSADVSYTYTLKVQQDQPGATESSDTIALVVTDNSATPKSANGNLVIQIMDDMPTATNDASSITRGSATVLGNAFTNDRIGADGPQAVGAPVTGITGGSLGTPLNGTYGAITLNANGTYSYALDNSNPAVAALLDGQKLTETFTYTITDKDGDTSTATLTITVNGLTPNALPVAVNDDFTLPEDQVLTGTLTGNDVPSADGGNVWAKATDPQHGKVVVGPDGRFVYVPDPDYHGPDSFTYTITDVNGDQSTATVTLTVLPVDDVPVAVADSAVTGKDKPVSGSLSGNDKPSGDGGNVWTKTTDPANGTVVVNPDGSYTYTPRPGFAGEDRFTYTVTDKDGDTSTATVTVTVLPNDVPVAVADRVSTAIDKPVSGSLSGNDKPSADGGNVWTKTTDPANGTVVVNPDGSYTYTPRPGFAGEDRFTYTVTDKDGDTSTATVTVTVVPNDVPVAVADRVSTARDKPVSGSLSGNDKPSADGGNVWAKTTDPANGTVVVNPDGSYTYTPRPGFAGEDRFTYTVTDKDGDTSTATVTVEVVGSTQLPVQPPVQPPSGLQPEPRPETPAMPDRPAPTQPAHPLQGDQVRDQSVFFDGALVTNLPRLSIPLHPIVYVTPQVNASQAERENSDPLFFSNPRAVQHGDMQSRTIGAGLGMDPALFVQHAVRDSQARGVLLGNIVDGRLPRLSLGSDGSIPTPQWFEPDPGQIVPEQPGERPQAAADAVPAPDTVPAQRADASPAGATPSTARPAAAPSFSEQLRNAGGRAPAVAARQASPVSSVS